MTRDDGRASFNVAFVLNEHRSEENPAGRAQRGPFVRLACMRLARRALLKTPSSKAVSKAIAR